MGGGLAVDFTLDVRLRFGGRAGGSPGVSFREELGISILKHTYTLNAVSHPDSWNYCQA